MRKVIINGRKYIPNMEVFKVRNKWTLAEKTAMDTFTGKLDLITNLSAYVDIDNIIKYSSNLITVELPKLVIVSICKSRLDDFKNQLIPHPTDNNKYVILGKNYNFNRSDRFQPKNKTYSVTESKDKLAPYTELENGLDFLQKYTYGIELETVGLDINKQEVNTLGFHELYDGSITGPEYATDVMKYNNLHHVEYFLKLLKTVSKHDHTCSLHIHIGNVEYNPDNLCAIYSLFQRLQEDLNLLIAPYKKDYKFLYEKQKDHCQNLPLVPKLTEVDIKELFRLPTSKADLLLYITRSSKWNLLGRYYTVNFLNYICKHFPNNTIECRSLQMTFNYDYALTWLIINTSIIHYAINNIKKVLDKKEKIQIEDCLNYLISDPIILERVTSNYHKIKNIIYSRKYLDSDYNTNSMLLDECLRDLVPITTSFAPINNDCFNSLVKIDIKKIQSLKLVITPEHKELGPFSLRLSGNWVFPAMSDIEQLLQHLVDVMDSSNLELSHDEKYVIPGTNIRCGSLPMYRDSKILHYATIENGTIYYKVEQNGAIQIKSIGCSYLYKKKKISGDFFVPIWATDNPIIVSSRDLPTLDDSEEE